MKSLLVFSLFSFFCLSISLAQTNKEYDGNPFATDGMDSKTMMEEGYVRYQVESGYLKMIITDKKGKKKGEQIHYWDRWGLREARIEIDKKGNKSISYLDGEHQYNYNPEDNTYIRIKNTLVKPVAKEMGDKDMTEGGRKFMEGIGGDHVRNERFLEKDCEVWKTELLGVQYNWVWNGVSLKLESTSLGITRHYTGVELKTDINVPEEKVALPKDAKSVFANLGG